MVSDTNSNIRISLILEKLTFSGVKKGIYFREFGLNSRNSRNFLPAKISSLKVYPELSNILIRRTTE